MREPVVITRRDTDPVDRPLACVLDRDFDGPIGKGGRFRDAVTKFNRVVNAGPKSDTSAG
jgi:hypothetical protein